MNILQIRYFATVAQLESISKASELLFVSQSALSKNISKLEDELGFQLFTRKGKRLVLNAQGVRFLASSRRVLQELDGALEDISRVDGDSVKHISICVTGASRPLTDCIAGFHEKHPSIEFSVDVRSEDTDLPDINSYDVLIYPAGGRYGKYSGVPLYLERYCLAVNAAHPLAQEETVALQALSGQDIVFLRAADGSCEFPYLLCSTLHLPLRSRCFVDTPALRRQIVASGIAAALLTQSECAAHQQDAALRILPIDDPRFSRQMMVCFRREKHLSEAAKLFRDYVSAQFHLSSAADPASVPSP